MFELELKNETEILVGGCYRRQEVLI